MGRKLKNRGVSSAWPGLKQLIAQHLPVISQRRGTIRRGEKKDQSSVFLLGRKKGGHVKKKGEKDDQSAWARPAFGGEGRVESGSEGGVGISFERRGPTRSSVGGNSNGRWQFEASL